MNLHQLVTEPTVTLIHKNTIDAVLLSHDHHVDNTCAWPGSRDGPCTPVRACLTLAGSRFECH